MKKQKQGFFLTPKKLLLLVFLVAVVAVLLLAAGVFHTFKKPEVVEATGDATGESGHTVEILSPDGKPATTAVVDRNIVLMPSEQYVADQETASEIVHRQVSAAGVSRAESAEKKEVRKPQTEPTQKTQEPERNVVAAENGGAVESPAAETLERLVAEQRRVERVAQAKAELAEREKARKAAKQEAAKVQEADEMPKSAQNGKRPTKEEIDKLLF